MHRHRVLVRGRGLEALGNDEDLGHFPRGAVLVPPGPAAPGASPVAMVTTARVVVIAGFAFILREVPFTHSPIRPSLTTTAPPLQIIHIYHLLWRVPPGTTGSAGLFRFAAAAHGAAARVVLVLPLQVIGAAPPLVNGEGSNNEDDPDSKENQDEPDEDGPQALLTVLDFAHAGNFICRAAWGKTGGPTGGGGGGGGSR